MNDNKEVEEENKNDNEKSRRKFLKKLTYSTPLLVGLVQITNPTKASADQSGSPEGPPGWQWRRW